MRAAFDACGPGPARSLPVAELGVLASERLEGDVLGDGSHGHTTQKQVARRRGVHRVCQSRRGNGRAMARLVAVGAVHALDVTPHRVSHLCRHWLAHKVRRRLRVVVVDAEVVGETPWGAVQRHRITRRDD